MSPDSIWALQRLPASPLKAGGASSDSHSFSEPDAVVDAEGRRYDA
jgi:hypothetical protein